MKGIAYADGAVAAEILLALAENNVEDWLDVAWVRV